MADENIAYRRTDQTQITPCCRTGHFFCRADKPIHRFIDSAKRLREKVCPIILMGLTRPTPGRIVHASLNRSSTPDGQKKLPV